jgi:hypothetical protein
MKPCKRRHIEGCRPCHETCPDYEPDDAAVSSVQSSDLLASVIEATDRLSPYLRHERGCRFYATTIESDCDCGVLEKWKTYERLKKEANGKDECLP